MKRYLLTLLLLMVPMPLSGQFIQATSRATPITVRADSTFVRVTWRAPRAFPTGYIFSNYWLSLHKDGVPLRWATFTINDTSAIFRIPPAIPGKTSIYRLTVATVVRSTDTISYKPAYVVGKAQNIMWRKTNTTVAPVADDSVRSSITLRFSNSSTAALVIGDSMEIFERRFTSELDTVGLPLIKIVTIYPRDATFDFRWFVRGKKYKFYARTWYFGTTLTGDTLPLPAMTVILGNR